MNEDNRTERIRYRVKAVVESTAHQMGVLLRRIRVDADDVDDELRLPSGSYAEWSAVFQNILINAVNAMLDSPSKSIFVHSRATGKLREVFFEDTGSGVDVAEADKLFEPFERRQNVSPEHAELGYGGTGLGLTIVRMIAENLGCKVSFVEPSEGFSTTFRLAWEEK